MALSYIPIILNEAILSDGEAAQILSMINTGSTPTPVEKATNSNAQPYRKGKMRAVFLLQDSTGDVAADLVVNIRIRSPFPGDAGAQSNRPLISISPATAASALPTAAWVGEPINGLPGPAAPAVAADFSATFKGLAIPNWGVSVGHLLLAAPAPLGVFVVIDFGASAAN